MATSSIVRKLPTDIGKGCLVQSSNKNGTVLMVLTLTPNSKFTGVVTYSGHIAHELGDVFEELPVQGYELFTGSVTLTQS